ncbi:hypothetical protein CEXT_189021 [Caerostris extrusa]|uniref:Uncharacterized protein n=1 Tax=Caerostris extrusa TaxID=172846 RepID=A0AAV4PX46_CAEEX|nr:hypothetical protein CEXT_189021 [Caerostris extrusa]
MRWRTEGGAEGRDERKWLFSYPVIRFWEWNTSGCSGAPHLTNLLLSTAPSSVREPRFAERTPSLKTLLLYGQVPDQESSLSVDGFDSVKQKLEMVGSVDWIDWLMKNYCVESF